MWEKDEIITYLAGSAVYGRAFFSDAGINQQCVLSIWDCLLSREIHLYHHTVDGNNKLYL